MLYSKKFDRLASKPSASNSPKSPSSSHSKTDIESLVRELEEERCLRRKTTSDLFQQLLEEAEEVVGEGDEGDAGEASEGLAPPSGDGWPQPAPRGQGCKCSKISCLKLYCDCFNKGEACGAGCSCSNCHNQPGFESEVTSARMMANYRHPGYFKGVQAFAPGKKCSCKKSHCIKKYCECHNSGSRCSAQCECLDCHNRDVVDEGGLRYIGIQVKA